MAVQFILGRSGTGKTNQCIRSIVDQLAAGQKSSSPIILLVPEQATYQAERLILSDDRIEGYTNLHILSFNRLQFMLLGNNANSPEISRLGQEMIISKILKELAPSLKIFSANPTPGLAAELTATIIELHQCAKTVEDVQDLTEKLQKSPISALKFADIATIFEKYLAFMQNNFVNPDIQLTHAVKKVYDADFLQNANLFVDGFASFTMQQKILLAEMIKTCSNTKIALCLDPETANLEAPDPASIFNLTERTYADLLEMLKKTSQKIEPPVILEDSNRFASSALAHIERNIFTHYPAAPISADSAITVASPATTRAEVIHTARQIIKLVKQDGYRFRDIAVVASDLGIYQHYIEATFTDFGIEFFLDQPRPMTHHPVVELLTSALNSITSGFSSSDIFAYLKTDFSGLTRSQADTIENYCIAAGIDSVHWLSENPWKYAPTSNCDLREINSLRQKVISPLKGLKNSLLGSELLTAAEFTAAIFQFFDGLKVRQQISEWTDNGSDEMADQHHQFFEKLIDIFDEMCLVFADDKLAFAELMTVLTTALSKLTLKLIPQKLDQVLVGSIDRSRHPELKAVFLLGATQKSFPASINFDSILNDQDRAAAEENEFVLADNTSQQLVARQYLAYIAFTRPSERLFISYPLADEKGGEVMPSAFLKNLQSLFTDLTVSCPQLEDADLKNIVGANQLKDILCQKLSRTERSPDLLTEELVSRMSQEDDQQLKETAELVQRAVGYKNDAVLDMTKYSGMGDTLDCSMSRLRSFAACPYQHFAKYILSLNERKTAEFKPVDLGNFYHLVLERVSKELFSQKLDFATVPTDLLTKTTDQQIEYVIANDLSISSFFQRSKQNKFAILSAAKVLRDCVLEYAKASFAGTFRQRGAEVTFGANSEHTFEIELEDGKKVTLKGVIDRVDLAKVDGQIVAMVFDYKRRETTVSWEKLFYGFDMQLGLYMLAATAIKVNGTAVDAVAGAFYLPVESPAKSATLSSLADDKKSFSRKARGIFNGDYYEQLDNNAPRQWNQYYNFYIGKDGPFGNFGNSAVLYPDQFKKILQFTRERIASLANGIFAGNIAINPYRLGTNTPCDFCDFRSLCRFDTQTNDYSTLTNMNKKAFIELLDEQEVADE